jgi:hypothetical protein
MDDDVEGNIARMLEIREMPVKFCTEDVKNKNSAEDIDVHAKAILEWIL